VVIILREILLDLDELGLVAEAVLLVGTFIELKSIRGIFGTFA